MDVHTQQQRGRSPSVGHNADQRIKHSPSPHRFPDQLSPTDTSNNNIAFTTQTYNPTLSSTNGSPGSYNLSTSYLNNNSSQPQFQPHVLPSNDFGEQSFGQTYQQENLNPNLNAQHSGQQFQSDMVNTTFGGDFPQQQQEYNQKQDQFDDGFLLDPQLQVNTQQDQSINPADIMSNMSPPQGMQPTPPNLMPPNAMSSEPTSPFTNPGQQWSPNHSRHVSLDPSAAYTNGVQQNQPDWGSMQLQGPQFQGHRRAPSEHSDMGHSDVSSVAPSPFIAQTDNFDTFEHDRSPMVRPQQDNQGYDGALLESFSLSESQNQRPSPRHSPFHSPRMSPQPGLGGAQNDQFMPLPEMQNSFNGGSSGEPTFPNQTEQFPQFPPEARLGSNDYGQADAMAPPEINVEFAPSTQPGRFEPPRFEGDFDALIPPNRGKKHATLLVHTLLM